jgi:hypothetical protein
MILDVVISVIAALLFTRGRKKMNMGVTSKHYIWSFLVVFVVLAIAYGASGHISH